MSSRKEHENGGCYCGIYYFIDARRLANREECLAPRELAHVLHEM